VRPFSQAVVHTANRPPGKSCTQRGYDGARAGPATPGLRAGRTVTAP
jgi:hypothetical protein